MILTTHYAKTAIMAAAHKFLPFSERWRHSRPRFSGSPAHRSHPRGHDGGRAARRCVLTPRHGRASTCAPVISPSTLPHRTMWSFWRLCDARARCGEIPRGKSCGHARDPFCIGIAPHTQTLSSPEFFARAQCAAKQGTLARRLTGASGRPVELVASTIDDESFFAV